MTETEINKIAQEVDFNRCFVHKSRHTFISLPSELDLNFDELDIEKIDEESEPWLDLIKELNANFHDYIEIQKMESFESFKVMSDFTDKVGDNALREKLMNALNGRKPFANFKIQIDNSGDYRERWFEFKNRKMIEWVKKELANHSITPTK